MEEDPEPKAVTEGKQGLLVDKDPTPNYDAVFGEEKHSSKFSQDTPFGKVRNVKRFGWAEWVFIALGSLAFLGTLGLTIERLVHFYNNYTNFTNNSALVLPANSSCQNLTCDNWQCLSDVTFAVVLIMNLIFCVFYAFDGVLRERGMEILAVPVATVIVLIYLLANYIVFILHNPVDAGIIKLVRLVLAFIFGPPLIGFAIYIYTRTGMLRFTLVGGNKTLLRAYRFRSFLFTVTLFNIQLVANVFILSWTAKAYFIGLAEEIILPILTVYTLIVSILGWIGFYYELRGVSVVFIAFFSLTVAYPVFKIINVAINFNMYVNDCGWDETAFESIAISILVVCALTIVAYGLILVFSILVVLNFKKGLMSKDNPPLASVYRLIWKATTGDSSHGHEKLVDSSN